jgi:hypothetical protein
MSEVENAVDVETPPEPTQMELNLSNFVDAIQASNFNNASDLFNDMLSSKVDDAIEAEKVSVANNMFNGGEPSEEEVEEFSFDEAETEEVEDGEEDGFENAEAVEDHDDVEYQTEEEPEVEEDLD